MKTRLHMSHLCLGKSQPGWRKFQVARARTIIAPSSQSVSVRKIVSERTIDGREDELTEVTLCIVDTAIEPIRKLRSTVD